MIAGKNFVRIASCLKISMRVEEARKELLLSERLGQVLVPLPVKLGQVLLPLLVLVTEKLGEVSVLVSVPARVVLASLSSPCTRVLK
ncbi:MAG: hypothetical protein GX037_00050 [Trueperella sp.]|nr:hypothetical protein [Trueperella sp.]